MNRTWAFEAKNITSGATEPAELTVDDVEVPSQFVFDHRSSGRFVGELAAGDCLASRVWDHAADHGLVLGCNVYLPNAITSGMTGSLFCYVPPIWRHPIPWIDLRDAYGPAPPERCVDRRRGGRGEGIAPISAMRAIGSLIETHRTSRRRRPNDQQSESAIRAPDQPDQAPPQPGAVYQVELQGGDRAFLLATAVGNGRVTLAIFDFVVHETDYLPTQLFLPGYTSTYGLDIEWEKIRPVVLRVEANSDVSARRWQPTRRITTIGDLANALAGHLALS
jgi:hypothetical protein